MYLVQCHIQKKKVTLEGIEPPTFRSGVERATIAPQSHLHAYNHEIKTLTSKFAKEREFP